MRCVSLLAIPWLASAAFAQTTQLDSALRALEVKGFSGVVRIDRGGTTILEKGYGLADRADRTPFTPATIVQIGSNTKDFTAVALLQLYERGRLGIRDSLFKYFPAAPADKRNITLWQLANHVAGFPIGLGGDFEPLTRDQFLDAAFKRPLGFPPGSREQYSNTGYSILAAVIELVSGRTYDEYVRDNILQPLHLEHTGLLLPKFDLKLLAHGYRKDDDQGTMLSKPHAADGPYWNLRGNGGMLSTVGDMHAFYNALFGTNALLKPETRNLRFNPDEPTALAGSDLVNFFLYERLPRMGVELIIASNTAEFRERPVRQSIGTVMGLPSPDGGPVASAGPRPNAKPPASAVAALLNDFVKAVNSGSEPSIRAFIAAHFLIEAGSPGVDARVQRVVDMHANLGELKVVGMDAVESELVEISATSANEGALTLKVTVSSGTVPRIRSLQVMVGG